MNNNTNRTQIHKTIALFIILMTIFLLGVYSGAVIIWPHDLKDDPRNTRIPIAFDGDLSYDKNSDQYTLTYQLQGEGFKPEETVPVYLYVIRESDGSVISEFTEILTADESGTVMITPEFQINGSEFDKEESDAFKVTGTIGGISWK